MNCNCSNLLDMKNLQEQVKKHSVTIKLIWLFTVWINCSSHLKIFEILAWPSASNFKSSITRIFFSDSRSEIFWKQNTIIYLLLASRIVPITYILLPLLDQRNSTIVITEEQDLHVFILDDQELSLEKFMDIYGSRTRSNKEYWLLDVSFVQKPEEKLQNLSLDLGPIFL